eukprot:Phypoly_transcript_06984.p1 GENE.Phypoly_transcript_06984~~Phypoly_transcript_06984.p1  ORF type:complete len:260 (+),score=33.84 Phypoly_transcript_06984:783-1562(+)
MLGADYHILAWSGKGVIRNVNSLNSTSANTLPTYYNKTLGSADSPIWDFSSWVPHIIFINLGTNDFSGGVLPTSTQFINGYIDFVNHLHSLYKPTPKFFFACGVMINTYCPYIKNVSAVFPGSTVVDLFAEKVNSTVKGCDNHPSIYTDLYMAQAQASVISDVMGWSVSPTTGAAATTSQPTTSGQPTPSQSPASGQPTTSQSPASGQPTTSQSTLSQSTSSGQPTPDPSSSGTTSPISSFGAQYPFYLTLYCFLFGKY